MKTHSWLWLVPALALVGGCDTATKKARSAATVIAEPEPKSDAWKRVATAADQDRIARVAAAWADALSAAKPKHSKELASEGDLLNRTAALPRPEPTPGSYRCRLVSIGKTDAKSPLYQKFKPFFCYVLSDEEGGLTIVKQTGSRRPAGQLWEDDLPTRMIFLGSLALADEKEPLGYGEDPARDTAGIFERIGPFKWRLVIPWPRSGAKLEVFELTPVADQPAG